MAETTGPINGTLVKLYKGTIPFANLISNDWTIDKTTINVSSKSSSGAEEFIAGRYTWSCSAESILEYDGSVGTTEISLQDILTDLLAGTAWSVVIGTGTTGDLKLSGSAYLKNAKASHPDNDKSTFTVELQGTGALTPSTF
jgi:hypothetical protein